MPRFFLSARLLLDQHAVLKNICEKQRDSQGTYLTKDNTTEPQGRQSQTNGERRGAVRDGGVPVRSRVHRALHARGRVDHRLEVRALQDAVRAGALRPQAHKARAPAALVREQIELVRRQ
ncbi:hypothetical protein FI667_g7453, partial [Globisporangium splendens]